MWFEIILVFILFKYKKNVPTFLEFGLYTLYIKIYLFVHIVQYEKYFTDHDFNAGEFSYFI